MTYPLNQSQLGVYYACQSEGVGDYIIYRLFRLGKEVDKDRLIHAIGQAVHNHPHLFDTIVTDEAGEPVWEVADCTDASAQETWQVEEVSSKEALEKDPEEKMPMECRLFSVRLMDTDEVLLCRIAIHHILADGMSFGILCADISRAYNGETLVPESVDARALNTAEATKRQSNIYTEEKSWYEQTFGGVESVSLPLRDLYAEGEEHYQTVWREMSVRREAIKELCAATQTGTSIPFTTAFALMLHAFTGDEQVSYASFYHGRGAGGRGVENTVTMAVRTLPMLNDLTQVKTVGEMMQQTAQMVKTLREKDSVGFGEVCDLSGMNSEVSFIYQGSIIDYALHLDGNDYPMEDMRKNRPGLKISAQMMEHDGAYTLRFEYPAHEYSECMVNEMLDTYDEILRQMTERGAALALADLHYCTERQMTELDAFNRHEDNTFAEWEGETVLSRFRQIVARYPNQIAAVFGDKKFTYGELDQLTDRMAEKIVGSANAFVQKEWKAESGKLPVVSILIPRCELMFIAPLAAMKAGCTYQPLDPSYPKERLNFMVKDAACRLLITTDELNGLIDEPVKRLVCDGTWSEGNSGVVCRGIKAEDTMILLYTSGSTGVPKGVMLSHRNILAYIHWYIKHYGLNSESRIAAYASFGFDANMMDMYSALLSGGTLYVIPEEIRLDLMALGDFFDRNGITCAFMTTQVGQQMMGNYDSLKTLQHLSIGGEKMMSMPLPTGYTMHNIYGPTECSVAITEKTVTENEPNIPIGRPTETTRLYVVDKHLHRLPIGAAGELIASGPQVGQGYLNRPDKTTEAFIRMTVNGQEERCYRTGDIVRYRSNGDIEFVGRKDGQVKIRGFRIELKEVEAVIREYEGIKDVTVQAFDYSDGGKYIAAYIVSDTKIDISSLNDFILDRKPPYMVPAVTMQLERIPLNVNQKVDKKALPKPQVESQKSHIELPMNTLEKKLHDTIAGVVKNGDFGLADVLAFYGLTSISCIKLATLLYKQYGVMIDAKTFVKTGTLRDIEEAILEKWMSGEPAAPVSDTEQADEPTGVCALSNAQMGVCYECMKDESATTYNVPMEIVFPDSVHAEDIKKAVEQAIVLHPLLRAHLCHDGGDIGLTTDAGLQITCNIVQESAEELKKTFVRPFRLFDGPLVRAVVTGHTLLLDAHHLVMDGSSLSVLLHDVCDILNNRPVQCEDYDFFHYVHDEQQADTTEQESYFESQLKTVDESSSLPEDLMGKEQEGVIGVVWQPLPMAEIEAFCRTQGITPAVFFLAATEYMIARYTNSRDVQLCTISSGRSNVKIANTVGMFVNTLPLVGHIDDIRVNEFLQRVGDNFTRTLQNENYPFAKIAAKYGTRADIVYEYQVGVVDCFEVNGAPVSVNSFGLEIAKFKAAVKIQEHEGQVCIKMQYNDALYSRDFMERFADSMKAVCLRFMASPDQPLRKVSIMSPKQEEEVAKLHTVAQADIPVQIVYQPLERWSVETPDKTALIAVDGTYTYRELNARINRIAHTLIAKGVRRGDRVVVLLPRTSAVICCLYGVSKTGAAYIPCDPAYPAERIKLITEDSGAKYVITTQDKAAEYGEKAIVADELMNSTAADTNPGVDVQPDDTVYLIYTSGSTGRPKGVMLRHKGICNHNTAHPCNRHIYTAATEGHTFLAVTTLSFDMSLKEYSATLFNGQTLVLAGDDQSNNPLELAKLFLATGADVFNATPSRLLNYMESEDFCEGLRRCKAIYSGGEPYSDRLLDRLHKLTKARIFNTYGPTETTVSCNVAELTHTDRISIGEPLLNVTEFIVDIDGNEQPVGVVGELYIGGEGVGKGYNNLPEQTAARFVEYRGMRVYRSGDYARWLPDGKVVTLGRMDNQIKLRGLRIELGEVEAAVSRYPGIKQVTVMVRTLNGKEHLAAYFTADRPIDVNELKTEVGKTLTPYMVPTAYLQLDAFPLTPNGKTDIKHLPEPVIVQTSGEYTAPANQVERDFCDIFKNVLELDKVSATESFFELGGTSLVATRVLIEATRLGYALAYADIFSHPSPRELAIAAGGDAPQPTVNDAADVKNDEGSVVNPKNDDAINNYDYTAINELLQKNTLDSFRQGERLPLGNVLLTGATGYLGIHIFRELMEHYPDTKIYCLLRPKRGISAAERLRQMLYYYFETNYAEAFGSRVFVYEGDVTAPITVDVPVDTVINCAAIVKHFSEGTEIEDINIGGVKNCIDYCLKTGARFIQTSTCSTGGTSINGFPDPSLHYSEQTHYMGQCLTGSKYVYSKFIAERMTLEAIIEKGLVAKVVRLGNLAARAQDGEFQINFRTNSAMGRLHIYQMLGQCGYTQMASQMEFSPIDEVARAVVLLATAPKECVIFHPFNNHMMLLGDVIQEMAKTLHSPVDFVEDNVFQETLMQAGQDPEKAKILQSMLAYKAAGKDVVLPYTKYNPYTIQVLARLGFRWNMTSWDYVQRFIRAISSLDFFQDHR